MIAATTMAEYRDYGPGWNETARAASGVSIVMTEAQYAPYASVEKVFQYANEGRFGNVGWIDGAPEG